MPKTATPAADPAQATIALADALSQASVWLFNFRRGNPNYPQLDRVRNLEFMLDDKANALTGGAIKLLGDQVDQAVSQLQSAATRVDQFMQNVAKVEAALTVVTDLLGTASAALMGDAPAVLKSLDTLADAMEDAKELDSGKA